MNLKLIALLIGLGAMATAWFISTYQMRKRKSAQRAIAETGENVEFTDNLVVDVDTVLDHPEPARICPAQITELISRFNGVNRRMATYAHDLRNENPAIDWEKRERLLELAADVDAIIGIERDRQHGVIEWFFLPDY